MGETHGQQFGTQQRRFVVLLAGIWQDLASTRLRLISYQWMYMDRMYVLMSMNRTHSWCVLIA